MKTKDCSGRDAAVDQLLDLVPLREALLGQLRERELAIERREIHRNPNVETVELSQLYQSRGVDADVALDMARNVMKDPELALEVHAREELGIDPNELGNPLHAAASSFVAFAAGAVLPLIPWFFTGGTGAVVASVVLGLLGAVVVGWALARATERDPFKSMARQVFIAAGAAGVTYLVGTLVGAEVT